MPHAKTVSSKEARQLVDKAAEKDTLIIVFCSQPWCKWCLEFKPNFENVAKQFDCCDVKFLHVDMSSDKGEMGEWLRGMGKKEPTGFPTIYAFKHGKYKAITQGFMSNDELREWLVSGGLDCGYCETGRI